MAIAAVAATVGSISGTVAWFQYSTRSTAAYRGASAHCTENLEIRIRAGTETTYPWKRDLLSTDINTYLTNNGGIDGAGRTNGNALHPVTSQDLDEGAVATTLYKNPIYQYATPSTWGIATLEDYIVIPLELRVLDVDGAASETFLQKKIYITNIDMAAQTDDNPYFAKDHLDLTPALRVGVSAGTNANDLAAYTTFSMTGETVNAYGTLDLNGDGAIDQTAGYEWTTGRRDVMYGADSEVADSHPITQLTDAATDSTVGVAYDANPYAIKGKAIGTTDPANETATLRTLKVDLKVYLEGWTSLAFNQTNTDKYKGEKANLEALEAVENPTAGDVYNVGSNYYRYSTTRGWQVVHTGSIWDAVQGVGAKFNLGIRFSAEAHIDADHAA